MLLLTIDTFYLFQKKSITSLLIQASCQWAIIRQLIKEVLAINLSNVYFNSFLLISIFILNLATFFVLSLKNNFSSQIEQQPNPLIHYLVIFPVYVIEAMGCANPWEKLSYIGWLHYEIRMWTTVEIWFRLRPLLIFDETLTKVCTSCPALNSWFNMKNSKLWIILIYLCGRI